MVFIDQANVAEVMCEPQILVPEVEGVPQNEQLPEVEAAAGAAQPQRVPQDELLPGFEHVRQAAEAAAVSNPQDASEYE